MSVHDLFVERPYRETDKDFVLASWLRSYWYAPIFKGVEKQLFYKKQNEIAKLLLSRGTVRVLVSKEDDDTIVGWIATEGEWIHYVYMKQSFRRAKLANRLVGDRAKWRGYTHKSLISEKIDLPWEWEYDPYRQWLPSL